MIDKEKLDAALEDWRQYRNLHPFSSLDGAILYLVEKNKIDEWYHQIVILDWANSVSIDDDNANQFMDAVDTWKKRNIMDVLKNGVVQKS